ncbi:Putative phosducin, Thioredoxin-like superfamily [Septoria linicola]|uniref:Phosducin, Thioredoxin-like superfamily n=1 Tax=Septoria linicola TaxID=215465 RepID=A0A9Q9AX12_9PEZI|nr:putative phosducin, Thioredoxin-like superfamily [Septoria linicola]USW53502.1 Putative phosducin, Thioredoxin-like superfamily [Septoria linicola]
MSGAKEEFDELMRHKERRTRHPEDDRDDARSFLNLSDESDDDVTPPASVADPPRASMSSGRSTIPMKRYGANTGPKGVISDAQDFQESRRSQRASMRSTSSLATQVQSLALHEQVLPSEKIDEEDEFGLDGEDEDDFMKIWRQSRLKEMQTGPKESHMHRNGNGSSTRLFGSLTMVDDIGYLDAVEKSGPDTVVIVYIYDDYSQVSDLIEKCIRTLAGKHQDARFIKLHYEDAQMEPMGVPAIIAYRNGDKFAGLVPLIDELPDDSELNAITLETVFKKYQILR